MSNEGKKYQWFAPETVKMSDADFDDNGDTSVYWLTGAGVMINSHGTIILVDPCITVNNGMCEDTDLKFMRFPPISAEEIPKVDAVLYTHADFDHTGLFTMLTLVKNTDVKFYGTACTCREIVKRGVPENRCVSYSIGDGFDIGSVRAELTICDHGWMLDPEKPEKADFVYDMGDCCGFKFTTSDGIVWCPGDTILLSPHFTMKDVDVAFLGVDDDLWHMGSKNAARLYNALDKTEMIVYHCGTYDAPELPYCNGDPADVIKRVKDPSRLRILAPGQKYTVRSQH